MIRRLWEKLKRMLRIERCGEQDKPKVSPERLLRTRLDEVKRKIPRSSFRKKLTPYRRDSLRRVLYWMTPQERALAQAKGWDRGIL